MSCRTIRKRIPLFVGGELSASKSARVKRHLVSCPECRTEAEEIERSRAAVREMARAGEAGDFSPAEWRRMIRQITGVASTLSTSFPSIDDFSERVLGKVESVDATPAFRLRPVLAAALGVLAVAGLFLFQKELRSPAAPETGSFAAAGAEAQPILPPAAPTKNPDVTSVTIRAPETGASIIWFYNKKFEWQGFGK